MSSRSIYSLSHTLSRLSLSSRNVCLSCRTAQSTLRNSTHPSPLLPKIQSRPATHAAAGVANGPKNRPGRRLGAKRSNGEYVIPNTIIFRQRGTEWHPGENVGRGRDHTIVARQPGYVRYYRDPAKHPDRKYIGVVFDAQDQLPYPVNAPRKRRLGLVAVKSNGLTDTADALTGVLSEGTSTTMVEGKPVETEPTTTSPASAGAKQWPWESYNDVFTVTTKTGDTRTFKQGKGGAYRMTNWEIGRAAEHAGVKIAPYKKDRFLAWRKRSARKAKSALSNSVRAKKGKKVKK